MCPVMIDGMLAVQFFDLCRVSKEVRNSIWWISYCMHRTVRFVVCFLSVSEAEIVNGKAAIVALSSTRYLSYFHDNLFSARLLACSTHPFDQSFLTMYVIKNGQTALTIFN